eukprot:4587257-Pyramimonas_sp.AAC.1
MGFSGYSWKVWGSVWWELSTGALWALLVSEGSEVLSGAFGCLRVLSGAFGCPCGSSGALAISRVSEASWSVLEASWTAWCRLERLRAGWSLLEALLGGVGDILARLGALLGRLRALEMLKEGGRWGSAGRVRPPRRDFQEVFDQLLGCRHPA